MGKILVLGGSRYFGKRLVSLLALSGEHEVTVATRGLTAVNAEGNVRHLRIDRGDEASLHQTAVEGPWDVVYDNICFTPNDALAAIRAFDGKVRRYVLTSTMSVYGFSENPISESGFDPYIYELKPGGPDDFDYGEGKRMAEAAFFQRADFPVSALRIPIVLGPDDYTRRLHWHVERIRQGLPIVVPNPDAAISFISSGETASFLSWLGHSEMTGPINACSDGNITIGGVIRLIEEIAGKQAVVHGETQTNDDNASPFGIPSSWVLDNGKAKAAGFRFEALTDWLPELIREIAAG
ncbi:NAD-dependent dehydratase [Paenibacillus sp. FSL R5-0527]|uniref:NAD-dependent dehydratase n=1 Tax=Paenibacillus TaxID=44249 RepID=UPI00097B1BE5|nr:NAD-dependent epimerase/dehydratase family protein [Paenibacillus macerans]OMG46099.1 NAD-dependent dehydratase [Paenibacillus macerans]